MPNNNKVASRTSLQKTGLACRLAATSLVMLVVDKQASMEDLTDEKKGLSAFLKLDARDQSLARAIALATLRHGRRIEAILQHCWDRKPPRRARFLIFTLHTAVAQVLFMDIPQSAAVDLATAAIKRERSTTRFAPFVNAVLRKLVREKEHLLEKTGAVSPFPPLLAKKLGSDFGKAKLTQIGEITAQAPVLDLNGKPGWEINRESMLPLPGESARLLTDQPVSQLDGFSRGDWWVQDVAAAQAARLLGDVTGKTVADLCAAPGGKTMQLATMGADVSAVDISAKRLERLQENLDRTGLSAKLICADLLKWEPEILFDAILLDVPCSATGTVRRHPDILWNTSQAQVTSLIELQHELINRSASWLKPGGILVYANCSLLKEEGENLVAGLQIAELEDMPILPQELPGLEMCLNGRGQFRSLPHYLQIEDPHSQKDKSGMDGFFVARFRKSS